MKKIEISVAIPAYNDAKNLERDLDKITKELNKITKNYEVIIAEDGCSDNSYEVADKLKKLKKYHNHVRHLHSDARLGKGGALSNAFRNSNGEIFMFMDSDLATDLKHTKELVEAIINGADIATGSRYVPGSQVKQISLRNFLSRTYNILVRLLLKSQIRDHQCGFKAFKKSSTMKILGNVKDKSWFWDTEILIKAQKDNLKIVEMPVVWHYSDRSSFDIFKDSFYLGKKLMLLKFRNIFYFFFK